MQKKVHFTKPFSISNLCFLVNTQKLLLNSSYQRNAVWRLAQEQLFIDSLFKEFDIPKVFFREVTKGSYTYEVIDGQQRIRTLNKFLKGDFTLSNETETVDGHPVAGLRFDQLHIDLQMLLQNATIDVAIFNTAYSDQDIEVMFLRLQNGTPLNAPEKRRAIAGNARKVIQQLANHKIFTLCEFGNERFGYEDAVAKLLHLVMFLESSDGFTDVRPVSIQKTYESNTNISQSDASVTKIGKAFNFLKKAFGKAELVKLKKYSLISLSLVVIDFLEKYNLTKFPEEFAEAYRAFDLRRIENDHLLPLEARNVELSAYTNAARADNIKSLDLRDEMLKKVILLGIPTLVMKDPTRAFSEEQRRAIYMRDRGICAACGNECGDEEFHADHIKPHAVGGETNLSNGQLLCQSCNLKKGDRQTSPTTTA